jgi:arabinose-5-phosphate isomerase
MLRPVREILRFRVGVNVATADDSLSVEAALSAAELPGVRRPGALMLVSAASGGALTGILTDADLRRLIAKDPAAGFLKQPVRDVMTRAPGTLSDDSLVRDAVRMVRENRRDEIPVIDPGGRPVGLLDVQDLVTMRLITGEHGS